jgi:tRNA-specific 2-thiouridylase
MEIAVRVRSTRAPQPATLWLGGDCRARVLLAGGELGVAAGQACVFYADEGPEARVLGGGFIERTLRQEEWVGEVERSQPVVRQRTAAVASNAA